MAGINRPQRHSPRLPSTFTPNYSSVFVTAGWLNWKHIRLKFMFVFALGVSSHVMRINCDGIHNSRGTPQSGFPTLRILSDLQFLSPSLWILATNAFHFPFGRGIHWIPRKKEWSAFNSLWSQIQQLLFDSSPQMPTMLLFNMICCSKQTMVSTWKEKSPLTI